LYVELVELYRECALAALMLCDISTLMHSAGGMSQFDWPASIQPCIHVLRGMQAVPLVVPASYQHSLMLSAPGLCATALYILLLLLLLAPLAGMVARLLTWQVLRWPSWLMR
jgi:hypothetical protein